MDYELIYPAPELEAAYWDYINECEAAEGADNLVPYSARPLGRSYPEWLADTYKLETEAPEGLVTAHTFFYGRPGGPIVGAINLRHTLSDYLRRFGGHIGYGVRPSMRRQGHATRMLALALSQAKKLGLQRVLITCNKQNTASAKTIQKNGGVLEDEIDNPGEGETTQRYWVDLAGI